MRRKDEISNENQIGLKTKMTATNGHCCKFAYVKIHRSPFIQHWLYFHRWFSSNQHLFLHYICIVFSSNCSDAAFFLMCEVESRHFTSSCLLVFVNTIADWKWCHFALRANIHTIKSNNVNDYELCRLPTLSTQNIIQMSIIWLLNQTYNNKKQYIFIQNTSE